MTRRSPVLRTAAVLVLAASAAARLAGQAAGTGLVFSQNVDGWFPRAADGASVVSSAWGSSTQLSFFPLRSLEAFARFSAVSLRLESEDSLTYLGGALGLGWVRRLSDRVSLGLSAFAGLGRLPEESGYGLYELGARLEARLRLSAALTLGMSAGYQRLATPEYGFLDAPQAGLRIALSPAELKRSGSRVLFEKIETGDVFPVLRSWYDTRPLGSVVLRNEEDGEIRNLRVSFHAPDYMGGPRLCAAVESLKKGEAVTVPLHAVFDERVLAFTENVKSSAAVDAEYSFLGTRRNASENLSLLFHHRNAMKWEDDRRAAVFVSPTDPAALWFARYASGVVRDRRREALSRNLQHALGIFEALKLYGVAYVVDPNSSYVELSDNAAAVDYLQYPGETLMYRGGDCDDLAILYCSLLESAGIPTAFITVPGHIFMAFDLGIDEAEARTRFFDPGLLIFRGGRAWAPVEITMVKEGFVKAWRVGAKQWIDNERAGTAAFFPMRDSWAVYKPSGLQNASSRFDLPDEATLMAAFDAAVDRFVVRELGPVIAGYEKRLRAGRDPGVLNEYGSVLASAGMLDPAWELFKESADAGFVPAWNNLANIAFIRKDYPLARSYYEWAGTLTPGDPVAVLGTARCAFELDAYAEAGRLHGVLVSEAPVLAERFGYLASVYGGRGRAWSMADRLAGTIWSRPGLSFKPPAAPVAAVPAPPPPAEAKPPARAPIEPAAPPPIAAIPAPAEAISSAAAVTLPAPVETAPAETTPPATFPIAEAPAAEAPVEKPAAAAPAESAPPAAAVTLPAPVEAAPAPSAPPRPEAPAPQASPAAEGVPPEKRPRPPVIVSRAPADADIAEKIIAASPVPAETKPPAAARSPDAAVAAETKPPVIVSRAPSDADITEKTVARAPEPAAEREAPVTLPAPPGTEAPPAEAPPDIAVPETVAAPDAPSPEPAFDPSSVIVPPGAAPDYRVDLLGPGIRTGSGTWERDGAKAAMTNPRSMYAKLVIPARAFSSGATAYEFAGRSTGGGFSGFGIHIHGRGDWKLSRFGGGRSLLVWITSDPEAYGDAGPRLQVYTSSNETALRMITSVRIPGSAFENRSYRVEYDPEAGVLAVLVDGVRFLETGDVKNPPAFGFSALRALNTAEFSDLKIIPLGRGNGRTPEADND